MICTLIELSFSLAEGQHSSPGIHDDAPDEERDDSRRQISHHDQSPATQPSVRVSLPPPHSPSKPQGLRSPEPPAAGSAAAPQSEPQASDANNVEWGPCLRGVAGRAAPSPAPPTPGAGAEELQQPAAPARSDCDAQVHPQGPLPTAHAA